MTSLFRGLTIVAALFVAASAGRAQLAPLIQNVDAHSTTSLDGQWQAIVDPYDVGAFDYRGQPLKNNAAFYKDYKPKSKSELVEYDFDTSGRLNVPGDWNTQRDALLFYEGSVWYKRSFDYREVSEEKSFSAFWRRQLPGIGLSQWRRTWTA